MHIFFTLLPPFLEQPSIQRCASRCKPYDHLESASFETNDLRRSCRAIVLPETHKDAKASVSQLFGLRTQAKLWLYLMLSGNKFWFCLVSR